MQRIHFISIGGAVMHNLAIALHKKGVMVTGSDDEINDPSRSRLAAHGLLPAETGWYPEKIHSDLDAVILGMHARKDNPELRRALELNVPVYSFPEFLCQQSADKLRVVIGGSHGKTTITAMVMHVLKFAGRDFDYMVGAGIEGFDTMVRITKDAPLAVFEGDEYLASPIDPRPKFHLYQPRLALLSGISWDHINVFPTREIYHEQFAKFIQLMDEGAVLVWCSEDQDLARLVHAHGEHLTARPYALPEHYIEEGKTFLVTEGGHIPLQVFGRHNLLNLEGARLICSELNVDQQTFFEAIQHFKGAAKRLELVKSNPNTAIYKDFAHSPSKLAATIEAVVNQYPARKLTACMELHTFSSLNPGFLDEYKGTMDKADEAIIYFNPDTLAHKKLEHLSAEQIKLSFGKEVKVVTDKQQMMEMLMKKRWNDRNLLLMSSGTFGGLPIEKLAAEITS